MSPTTENPTEPKVKIFLSLSFFSFLSLSLSLPSLFCPFPSVTLWGFFFLFLSSGDTEIPLSSISLPQNSFLFPLATQHRRGGFPPFFSGDSRKPSRLPLSLARPHSPLSFSLSRKAVIALALRLVCRLPSSASRALALALASGALSWPPLTTIVTALSQAGRNPDRPPPPYCGYLRPDR
jgi:hypothetical protein